VVLMNNQITQAKANLERTYFLLMTQYEKRTRRNSGEGVENRSLDDTSSNLPATIIAGKKSITGVCTSGKICLMGKMHLITRYYIAITSHFYHPAGELKGRDALLIWGMFLAHSIIKSEHHEKNIFNTCFSFLTRFVQNADHCNEPQQRSF